MRRRAVVALALAGIALASTILGTVVRSTAVFLVAGIALFAAIAAGTLLLPWGRWVPIPPMAGLFLRPTRGQRWCTRCGIPAPAGECAQCGTGPRRKGRAAGGRAKERQGAPLQKDRKGRKT